MRLVFVTQTLDAEHPALAQTLDLVGALAQRADELVVLCQSLGTHEPLPPNVRIRVFGAPSRGRRGMRFARALAGELRRRPRPDAVLAHMVPLYVLLAAPLAKPRRVPLLLWYTHWHAGRTLRLAVPLLDAALSVSSGSFPLRTAKLRPIGHAIDVGRFAPAAAERPGGRLRLLALGRTARWKGYDTVLTGLERAVERGLDAELEIRGPQLTDDERAHAAELRERIGSTELLRDRVRIEQPLLRAELPELLRGADALVSATQPRASETLDKVVYEAAAAGLPVLASNAALTEFLADLPVELRFRVRDADDLADRLLALGSVNAETRRQTGLELRRRVVESHSLDAWADAVAGIVAGQGRK